MADNVKKPAAPAKAKAKPTSAAKPKPKAKPAPRLTKEASAAPKETVAQKAATATETLKNTATKLSKQASDKARSYVDEGKARAGGALEEVSRLMGDAAGTVDNRLGPEYGKYARSAADTISDWSDQIKGKELEDLLSDARDFVKKSPAVAIGVAAALGFVVARLIKAGVDSDRDD
ncbi:MAG: hypothetical protein K2P68_04250 [Sphingomonas sp.]|nr:hypothetical protein [Sphingomonas sp.]